MEDSNLRTGLLPYPAFQAGAFSHSANSPRARRNRGGSFSHTRTDNCRRREPARQGSNLRPPAPQAGALSTELQADLQTTRRRHELEGRAGCRQRAQIGMAGFEPATSPSRRERATKLRHIPRQALPFHSSNRRSGWQGSNLRPPSPQLGALPTAPHPVFGSIRSAPCCWGVARRTSSR